MPFNNLIILRNLLEIFKNFKYCNKNQKHSLNSSETTTLKLHQSAHFPELHIHTHIYIWNKTHANSKHIISTKLHAQIGLEREQGIKLVITFWCKHSRVLLSFSLLSFCFFAAASINQLTLAYQLLNDFVWISINLINLHQYKIAYRCAATLLLERAHTHHAQRCILLGAQTNTLPSAICTRIAVK